MKYDKTTIASAIIAASGLIVFGIFAFISEGSYGSADGLSHYKLARYSFEYPELFLDHWGKPVFTLLSSPFAQFGLKSMKLFNVLIASLTAFFGSRLAQHLGYRNSYVVALLVLFAPIYAVVIPSTLTEILFSFVLILSLYFFQIRLIINSSVILSFLPFVRIEGIILLPLFAVAYGSLKYYKAIPFLLSGFMLYSLLGSFYFKDILWVIHQMPYTGAADIYGNGRLFHFISNYKQIYGVYLSVLLVAGLFALIIKIIKSRNSSPLLLDESLIALSLVAYVGAHSIVWWLGLGGSVGMLRVMAGVIPLAAIIGLKGFNLLMNPLSRWKWIKYPLITMFSIAYIGHTFKVIKMPVPQGRTEKLVKLSADWFSENVNASDDTEIYYYNQYFFYFLNLNPYDSNVHEQLPNRRVPHKNIKPGSYVFWDAHFGPNEGQLPLKRLKDSEYFELIKVFEPEKPFQVLGGYDYRICLFKRVKPQ